MLKARVGFGIDANPSMMGAPVRENPALAELMPIINVAKSSAKKQMIKPSNPIAIPKEIECRQRMRFTQKYEDPKTIQDEKKLLANRMPSCCSSKPNVSLRTPTNTG